MTMLERKIRKKIEWAFYNYDSLKESAKEYIVEIAESQIAVNYDKLPVQSSNDNSIERAIINGIDKNIAYKWCKVVEQTIEHFEGTGKDTLIRCKYFEKKRNWDIANRLYISDTSVKYWINDILQYAFVITAYQHLVFEKDL